MILSLLFRFIMGVTVIVVSGCSTNQVLDSSPDTGPTAQLRVFSLPNNTYLYPGKSCYKLGSAEEILAHSGGKSFGALNALAILGGNKKIGMPETGDMTWSHHEFYVAANQPLTVVVSLDQGGQRSDGRFYHSGCGPIAGYFSPQANHHYDAALIVKHERCYLRMRELVMDEATKKVKPTEITIKPAPQCNE
ncbi:hypothetical protein LG201_01210 [Methylobacillus gramineus]|uniref:hypothetical protein n=1 Tax=Methylobacillus gramineus TaxID=755169 RepID=UPI001CFFF685|nr:hypothetical protein [Methylobacillus gramineus]MCB5183818.1 hypothetical protein [Methylobacillus gramineus]